MSSDSRQIDPSRVSCPESLERIVDPRLPPSPADDFGIWLQICKDIEV
jgi:hypothetical protein